jgi:hypothetical protein
VVVVIVTILQRTGDEDLFRDALALTFCAESAMAVASIP